MEIGYTEREMERIVVTKRILGKTISQEEASNLLGVCSRQVRRIVKRYKEEGELGIKRRMMERQGKYGEIKEKILKLVRDKYEDFGPTLASEKLKELDGIAINRETLRQWMIEVGIRRLKRRKVNLHKSRMRRERFGELVQIVQIDGSHHDWFEGRAAKCCLLVFIDDATSRLIGLEFVEVETSQGYMNLIYSHLNKYGRPLAYYSDRHSIFRTTKNVDRHYEPTQVHRSLKELDIELICANTPQAKGRVERANGVLQDRLVKEMRLKGISSIESANRYVAEYIEKHNKRFSLEAANKEDAHRPCYHRPKKLRLILSRKSERRLTKTLELSYNGNKYQVENIGKGHRYQHANVQIYEHMDGTIEAYKNQEKLDIKLLKTVNKQPITVTDKREIDAILNDKLKQDKQENCTINS